MVMARRLIDEDFVFVWKISPLPGGKPAFPGDDREAGKQGVRSCFCEHLTTSLREARLFLVTAGRLDREDFEFFV